MANERQPIVIPGSGRGGRDTTHRAPIPDGAKIGQFVCSSLLSGRDRERPDDPELQAKALFQKIRQFMKEAGGTPDNIVQVTVYLTNEDYRSYVNKEWLEMFPDPDNRPARVVTYREGAGGTTHMLVSLIAVV